MGFCTDLQRSCTRGFVTAPTTPDVMSADLLAACAIAVLAAGCGVLLGFAWNRFRVPPVHLRDRIDALLPQTQCEQCGYPGCRPYAEAIAGGDVFNKCAPGGQVTIDALANLLGRATMPPAPGNQKAPFRKLAHVREEECIGCGKCLAVCPVDAILGAGKHSYTVIASECTGCALCIPPCPVDCIDLLPASPNNDTRSLPEQGDPCINCGRCAEACPELLLPQQLYRYALAEDWNGLREQELTRCIACAACDRSCPSGIPLKVHFQAAQSGLAARERDNARTGQFRGRFESRKARLSAEQVARQQARTARIAAAKAAHLRHP